MANSAAAAAAAAVAVAILRSCPVCHPPTAPLLSIRGRHTVRTFTTTHQPSSQILSHLGAEAAEGKESMVDGKCH